MCLYVLQPARKKKCHFNCFRFFDFVIAIIIKKVSSTIIMLPLKIFLVSEGGDLFLFDFDLAISFLGDFDLAISKSR